MRPDLETCSVRCPCCGEVFSLVVDCSVPHQTYVEDCEVCCRPLVCDVRIAPDGTPAVRVDREEDVP
jgi:hypothetical protein